MMPVVPVLNQMIPRPEQELVGVFLDGSQKGVFQQVRPGNDVLVLPYDSETGIYPVGTAVKVEEIWTQPVMIAPEFAERRAVFARVSGRGTVRARRLMAKEGSIYAVDAEFMNLRILRKTYPVIDGAGWVAAGGTTEARGPKDIRVTIHGVSHQGEKVALSGDLGGLVTREIAHSMEHGIVRSLTKFALVTPKTLRQAAIDETLELKASLEAGYRLEMPEVFGLTSGGSCGNPLTGLAQFYLADEIQKNLQMGRSWPASLTNARLSALSRVTGDLELPTQEGLRVLGGLKHGMMHDDSPVSLATARAVLRCFPLSPWP